MWQRFFRRKTTVLELFYLEEAMDGTNPRFSVPLHSFVGFLRAITIRPWARRRGRRPINPNPPPPAARRLCRPTHPSPPPPAAARF